MYTSLFMTDLPEEPGLSGTDGVVYSTRAVRSSARDITVERTGRGTKRVTNHNGQYPYCFEIPAYWDVTETGGWMLSFANEDEVVGGLDILGYYCTKTIRNLYPSYADAIRTVPIAGGDSEAAVLVLLESPRPYSLDSGEVVRSSHAYFPVGDRSYAFDLYFQSPAVDDEQALEIARTMNIGR